MRALRMAKKASVSTARHMHRAMMSPCSSQMTAKTMSVLPATMSLSQPAPPPFPKSPPAAAADMARAC